MLRQCFWHSYEQIKQKEKKILEANHEKNILQKKQFPKNNYTPQKELID